MAKNSDEQWRLFLALEIPETLRTKLAALEKYLARFHLGARWVKPESLHITLKFLGDSDPAKVAALEDRLSAAANDSSPLELAAKGLGVFPNEKKPRVLWVGLVGDADPCKVLAARIDEDVHELGYAKETRPFRPHLTLARFKTRTSPKALSDALAKWGKHEFEAFTSSELVLFRSHLQPSGARHEVLWRLRLGA